VTSGLDRITTELAPLLDDAAFEASGVVLGYELVELADDARSARCEAGYFLTDEAVREQVRLGVR